MQSCAKSRKFTGARIDISICCYATVRFNFEYVM